MFVWGRIRYRYMSINHPVDDFLNELIFGYTSLRPCIQGEILGLCTTAGIVLSYGWVEHKGVEARGFDHTVLEQGWDCKA